MKFLTLLAFLSLMISINCFKHENQESSNQEFNLNIL